MNIFRLKIVSLCLCLPVLAWAEQNAIIITQEGGALRTGETGTGKNAPAFISRDEAIRGSLTEPFEGREGSITLWIRPEDWQTGAGWRVLINWRSILSSISEGSQSLMLRANPDGRIVFTLGELEAKRVDSIEFPLLSGIERQWNHLALTWDATRIYVYVNGEQAVEHLRTYSSELGLGTTLQLGGVHGSGDEQGRTAVSGFSIHLAVLSPEEIEKLAADSPNEPSSLNH